MPLQNQQPNLNINIEVLCTLKHESQTILQLLWCRWTCRWTFNAELTIILFAIKLAWSVKVGGVFIPWVGFLGLTLWFQGNFLYTVRANKLYHANQCMTEVHSACLPKYKKCLTWILRWSLTQAPTINQGSFHVAGGSVDLILVVVMTTVFKEKAGVGQTLQHTVHEALSHRQSQDR